MMMNDGKSIPIPPRKAGIGIDSDIVHDDWICVASKEAGAIKKHLRKYFYT
jgi:hypothetical protein